MGRRPLLHPPVVLSLVAAPAAIAVDNGGTFVGALLRAGDAADSRDPRLPGVTCTMALRAGVTVTATLAPTSASTG